MEDYAYNTQKSILSQQNTAAIQSQAAGSVLGLNRAVEGRAFDRCINDANVIREQIAMATKIADSILERLAGPRAENDCAAAEKAVPVAGALGEIQRTHGASIEHLADLRRTLEQIGKYV